MNIRLRYSVYIKFQTKQQLNTFKIGQHETKFTIHNEIYPEATNMCVERYKAVISVWKKPQSTVVNFLFVLAQWYYASARETIRYAIINDDDRASGTIQYGTVGIFSIEQLFHGESFLFQS